MKDNKNLIAKEGTKQDGKNRWVFVPVKKARVVKQTNEYVLIAIEEDTTAIITTKFKRAKESDECIFLSVPYDYKISCRTTDYDEQSKKYVVTRSFTIYPFTLIKKLKELDVEEPQIEDAPLPF